MPRFKITLCRTAYEYADVDIEAEDLAAAEVQAIALADARKVGVWETCGEDDAEAARVINAEDLP